MQEQQKIIDVAQAAILNSTEIIRTCREIINEFSPHQHQKPKLIGVKDASKLVGYSVRFLKGKLETGELTGWKHKERGRWILDPDKLVEELKGHSLSVRTPTHPIKRRKNAL